MVENDSVVTLGEWGYVVCQLTAGCRRHGVVFIAMVTSRCPTTGPLRHAALSRLITDYYRLSKTRSIYTDEMYSTVCAADRLDLGLT